MKKIPSRENDLKHGGTKVSVRIRIDEAYPIGSMWVHRESGKHYRITGYDYDNIEYKCIEDGETYRLAEFTFPSRLRRYEFDIFDDDDVPLN